MSIRVALHHQTTYRYDRLVTIFPQLVRLRPAPHCRTPIAAYSLSIRPEPHFLNWQQDPHGNYLGRLVFPEPGHELSIEVDLVAEMTVINPFDFFLEPAAEDWPFVYEPWLVEELRPYLVTEAPGPRLTEWVASISRHSRRTVDFLIELNQRLSKEIGYVIRLDPGVQTCEQTLTSARGSCRDSAWLLVQILRNLGLAARFVSGYLIQLAADVAPLDGPAGPKTDFCDLHAWTEVYLPGAGWLGLDPTSGLMCGEGHIPLAATPDFAGAAPLTGSVEPCEVAFDFKMSVTRVHEDPRTTKPYRDDQWQAIDALGQQIDADLEAGAVRLTMGGEPTFVSVEDMDGEEWNFTAMGPNKRRLAGELIKRLRAKFAPGGFLHFSQGKWYPGEQLPRWALGCYWRKDGEPIWENDSLLADVTDHFGHDENTSQKFITALAERVAVDAECIVPAYEDAWHYLWRERRLPVNVDPLKSRLSDEAERERLARVFEQGLGTVVGHALPLAAVADGEETEWRTGPWHFRQERMFLIPGDSPLGWRLPLDSLPWVAKADRQELIVRDPLEARSELPQPSQFQQRYVSSTNGQPVSRVAARQMAQGGPEGLGGAMEPESSIGLETLEYPALPHKAGLNLAPGQSARGLVRTALCVEPREGRLHVFMPPVERLEDYLSLVTAVEQTAAELEMPIIMEGYPPPHDHRLQNLKLTPDPGVLEVNVQPASNWQELVFNTTTLYEEARQCRLGTEKFMLDGRHTGTCGGNHVVLGGPTAAESPMLRRPDLLRSLVTYWHNHPSLSYLFSGTFIGPTSQAPRVDEARHDSLYELEIACQQLSREKHCPPWLVDRLFRHLLIDVTGNTHRAEFCIDKLYSPDGPTGRLGLVELRGFEMPPHAQMSLVQQLLLRGLISRFWNTPYEEKLVRWGTSLHDRFLLPHFVSQDFNGVLEDLGRSGYELARDWFAPHFEFRFPVIGSVVYDSVNLELRYAIEPWNVLGEEGGPGGTVRYVDSSVERVQVKVNGLVDPRYIVTCNGRRVPLHSTGVRGEAVAGVRYRAWAPPECLHPTIGVHVPLVFDVFDTWNNRSIGGCAWHVAHPGGRHYETFPVNGNEAESRRMARFFRFGHTPGVRAKPPAAEVNSEFPFTLDLRHSPVGVS
ncbi:MAG TPA: transglutaminase family protein [Pirellulales bacterium]